MCGVVVVGDLGVGFGGVGYVIYCFVVGVYLSLVGWEGVFVE